MSVKPKRTGSQKPRARAKKAQPGVPVTSERLLTDLRDLILAARRDVARAITRVWSRSIGRSASASARIFFRKNGRNIGKEVVAYPIPTISGRVPGGDSRKRIYAV